MLAIGDLELLISFYTVTCYLELINNERHAHLHY